MKKTYKIGGETHFVLYEKMTLNDAIKHIENKIKLKILIIIIIALLIVTKIRDYLRRIFRVK